MPSSNAATKPVEHDLHVADAPDRSTADATNWDTYYKTVPATAKITRRYTTSVLLKLLGRYGARDGRVVEIGGANSCFVDAILRAIRPAHYEVIDTNAYGLSLLRDKNISERLLSLKNQSVLDLPLEEDADVVFSIGLIEHFDPAGTAQAIRSHFRLVKPGGCVVISFPTPTLLYRVARGLLEALGLWIFHDERPLQRSEVIQTACQCGTVVDEKLMWPLILTQRILVVKKPNAD